MVLEAGQSNIKVLVSDESSSCCTITWLYNKRREAWSGLRAVSHCVIPSPCYDSKKWTQTLPLQGRSGAGMGILLNCTYEFYTQLYNKRRRKT
jgi:hypothetical protein